MIVVTWFLAALALSATAHVVDSDRRQDAGLNIGEWLPSDLATGDSVRIHFAIQQRNVELLEKIFVQVSDPTSAHYGRYLSREEIAEQFSPAEETIQVVTSWLKGEGVDSDVVGLGGFVRVDVPVEVAERLLGARFSAFVHAREGHRIIRTLDACSLPSHVAAVVDFIGGVSNFPIVRKNSRMATGVAPMVTPQLLFKLYNVTAKGAGNNRNAMGAAEFEFQSFSAFDLEMFQHHFSLLVQPVRNVTGKGLLGHTEADLDVQYIMAMGQNIATDMWLWNGVQFDLLGWAQSALDNPRGPLVWSVSYGEALNTQSISSVIRLNQEFMKFGTAGISIIFASGDSGVWARGQTNFNFFDPDYPATLPAVTAVGATQLDSNGDENSGTDWSGGGMGNSTYFVRSSTAQWQESAVDNYFSIATDLPPSSYYDRAGIGYPDVSALGVNFKVFQDGFLQPVSGTSAASPTFAGVIALVNDMRIQAGKSTLGFLNPFIYSNPQAFHDITQGRNDAAGPGEERNYGFTAAVGWDPVTGMGTPNYGRILEAAMALP